jgi:hypothetical protein
MGPLLGEHPDVCLSALLLSLSQNHVENIRGSKGRSELLLQYSASQQPVYIHVPINHVVALVIFTTALPVGTDWLFLSPEFCNVDSSLPPVVSSFYGY